MDSTSSGGGYQPTKLICICRTLWSHGEDSTCPNLIPFSCILPSSYEDGDFQHPLPPSYTYSYSGAYTLFVSSHYSVNVRVKRGPHHMVGRFLTMTQQYETHNLVSPPTFADHSLNSLGLRSPSDTTRVLVHTATSLLIQISCLP